ncbi:hypothetical protein [uncultured Oscillibacter sp.]|uniref:hypothetical protein n=1 Tax=uncultured Oscillibacter sp. TaxID=876091 RepID=UPI002803DABE|nr:hypothetical protein [uncultured Oscillibacter sp.]
MEEPRTRLQIIVLIALAAMATLFGAALIISHCAFRGVAFSDTLLRVESSENAVAYTGEVNGITVCIQVEPAGSNRTDVVYQVGDRPAQTYTLEYPTETPVATQSGTTVDGVRIWRDGSLLFEGGLDPDAESVFRWYSSDGTWDADMVISFSTGADEDDGPPERLSQDSVWYFAQGPDTSARGSVGIYLLMLFSSALVALDAAFPRALFYIQHCCDVRDPEPSDFYLAMQRLGWVVYPVLILIGYLIGFWKIT